MKVALTFDTEHPDRPVSHPLGNASALLDLLHTRDVKATFFLQGKWAAAFPDLTARIRDDGHLLGCHSHGHVPFTQLTEDGIKEDLTEARKWLDPIAPTGDWFRFPGLAGHGNPDIERVVASIGYRHAHLHTGGNDWEPGRSPDEVANPIIEFIGGAVRPVVVLLHSWPNPTVSAVEQVLDACSGDEFVQLADFDDADIPR